MKSEQQLTLTVISFNSKNRTQIISLAFIPVFTSEIKITNKHLLPLIVKALVFIHVYTSEIKTRLMLKKDEIDLNSYFPYLQKQNTNDFP